MVSMVICGQIGVFGAQGVALPRLGKARVALKMVKVDDMRARTIKLQLKFVNRRHILANRTLVLTFCMGNQYELYFIFPLQSLLTKSLAFCLVVCFSAFSSICSSLKVGLSGLTLPGVPGARRALRRGELGVTGTSAKEECFEA